jgi:hypothetical protein
MYVYLLSDKFQDTEVGVQFNQITRLTVRIFTESVSSSFEISTDIKTACAADEHNSPCTPSEEHCPRFLLVVRPLTRSCIDPKKERLMQRGTIHS